MPGAHNVLERAGRHRRRRASSASPTRRSARALRGFAGVKRRFTRTGDGRRRHASSTTTATTRSRSPPCCGPPATRHRGPGRSPWCSRTATRACSDLFDEFCTCFNDADVVLVAAVYAAGEAPIEGVDRDALVEGLRRHGHRDVRPLDGPETWRRSIARAARPGDLVVCLGAGDITPWAHALPEPSSRRSEAGDRLRHEPGASALPPSAARCAATCRWRRSPGSGSAGRPRWCSCPADAEDLAAFLRGAADRTCR